MPDEISLRVWTDSNREEFAFEQVMMSMLESDGARKALIIHREYISTHFPPGCWTVATAMLDSIEEVEDHDE